MSDPLDMTSSSNKSLPADIFWAILEELAEDHESLKHCATVSRLFLRFSRKHLFRVIKLKFVMRSGRHPCARLHSVLSSHPEVASFIQELGITAGKWSLVQPTLPLLLHQIATANSLRVLFFSSWEGVGWTMFGPLLQDAVCALLGSTRLVTLNFSTPLTWDLPVAIFAIPPALKKLTFIQLWPEQTVSEDRRILRLPTMQPRAPTKLRTLVLAGRLAEKLVRYLTQPHCPIQLSELRELRVIDRAGEMVELAGAIMTAAEASLEHLVWLSQNKKLRDSDLIESTVQLDMRRMQALRTLEIRLFPYHYHCEWATRIVRDWGLPTTIETVSLIFDGAHFQIWPDDACVEEIDKTLLSKEHGLDAALASLCNKSAYPSLRKIKVELQIPGAVLRRMDDEVVQSCFGLWFPDVKKTGYLDGSCVLWLPEGEEAVEGGTGDRSPVCADLALLVDLYMSPCIDLLALFFWLVSVLIFLLLLAPIRLKVLLIRGTFPM
ncbi:hypothetical protein LshimejAT787_1900090 [Lyophyllum shimeji]|uniref:Uncharacterized protein n=1 Tax=Lyophyllum shimeji TaxID=47721 RepID=A0A9P3Q0C0_LYOSH|nr:hypothetical protein LshimejAT787_1900090 [Lyophyllum shimeji]